MKTETCKLYCRDFWIFLPKIIKIDLYNSELYRFKVGAFFETQCMIHVNTIFNYTVALIHTKQHRQQLITDVGRHGDARQQHTSQYVQHFLLLTAVNIHDTQVSDVSVMVTSHNSACDSRVWQQKRSFRIFQLNFLCKKTNTLIIKYNDCLTHITMDYICHTIFVFPLHTPALWTA